MQLLFLDSDIFFLGGGEGELSQWAREITSCLLQKEQNQKSIDGIVSIEFELIKES